MSFPKKKPPNGAVPGEGSLPNERWFGAYFTPNSTVTMTAIAVTNAGLRIHAPAGSFTARSNHRCWSNERAAILRA